ncbi:MAG: hypothetical protein KC501_21660 [Myxococcales bacterium]|nr:hypothetical protein [Myxococcales bacterium]
MPEAEPAAVRDAIVLLVRDVFRQTTDCLAPDTTASRQVWKWLWCDVVVQLVQLRKVDEELDDVLRACADPSFNPPTVPLYGRDAAEHPLPPIPRPTPPPAEPVPPMDGSTAGLPANLWQATTKEELAEIGLMRLMQGTAAGAPIKAPSAHLVLFAFNPAWPGLEQARAELARLAEENPRLSFVEASFVDTQRHFGKPEDLYGIAWAIAAAGPDGRVLGDPIVGEDPRDPPPTPEQWVKAIAHASGFVGAPPVQRLPRPRRFGDLVVAMASQHRGRPPARPRARAAPSITRRRAIRGQRRTAG